MTSYLVEVVPFVTANEESTTSRRRRHRIAAESALQAIRDVVATDGSRLISANESGPDRARGILESTDDENPLMYRVFAFPL